LFTISKHFFLQGALINTKLYNRLNKSTFEKIIYLKSWGIFINKEKEIKKKENKDKKDKKEVSKKDN
jgi:hypothetical protein